MKNDRKRVLKISYLDQRANRFVLFIYRCNYDLCVRILCIGMNYGTLYTYMFDAIFTQ